LQGFLTSMPFASPADGVVSTVSAKSANLQVATWSVPTPFINSAAEEKDVTLRAPVA